MHATVAKRLAQAIGTLLGGAVITFVMLTASPGDPARRILTARGQQSITDEQVLQERHRLGLDDPVPVRLWHYVVDLARGDLGDSWGTGRPVAEEIGSRLPATLCLALAALAFAIGLSLLLGLAAAWGAGRLPDRVARLISLVLLVVPSFLVGVAILDLLVVRLGRGQVIADGTWRTVLLPALTLGLASAASWSRVLRTTLLDAGSAPFLAVSGARGSTGARRLLVHQIPNALPPYVTIVGIEVAVLLGGAPTVESVYSWPGVGRFTVQAVEGRDMPVVVGFAMLAITLFVMSSLLVDVVNAAIDPRRRETA